jgi:hypothetical protein
VSGSDSRSQEPGTHPGPMSLRTPERKLDCGFRVYGNTKPGRVPTFRNPGFGTSGERNPSGFHVPRNARNRVSSSYESGICTRFWVPHSLEPGTHNTFPRKDNKSVCELSIISKTSIKMDLKMGSRSLGTEPGHPYPWHTHNLGQGAVGPCYATFGSFC